MSVSEYLANRLERDAKFRGAWEADLPHFALRRSIIASRINADMTQASLAAAAGLPRSTIARLESGESNPTVATLQKLSAVLGIQFTVDQDGVRAHEPIPAD